MKKLVSFMLFATMTVAAQAQTIDYTALNQDGFSDVAELLKTMTPEQQEAVLKAAAVKQQDLGNLTPEQQDKLRAELRKEGDTISMDKVDPEKLNVAYTKNTEDTIKDLDTYQTKYDQGKIDNTVVKPHTGE